MTISGECRWIPSNNCYSFWKRNRTSSSLKLSLPVSSPSPFLLYSVAFRPFQSRRKCLYSDQRRGSEDSFPLGQYPPSAWTGQEYVVVGPVSSLCPPGDRHRLPGRFRRGLYQPRPLRHPVCLRRPGGCRPGHDQSIQEISSWKSGTFHPFSFTFPRFLGRDHRVSNTDH